MGNSTQPIEIQENPAPVEPKLGSGTKSAALVIGLTRHFPVDYHFKKWSNSETFNLNMKEYDSSPIYPIRAEYNGHRWDYCFSSTMGRALKTADRMCQTRIIPTDLLREVPLLAGFCTKLKMPLFLWALLGRIQWWFKTSSQPENREMSLKRAQDFISQCCLSKKEGSRILVITHGFFMVCLRKMLLKKGFSGPLFFKPQNGKTYPFQKK